jgi:hypothetical protein
VPNPNIAFEIFEGLKVSDQPGLLSVVESVLIERVDSTSFLPPVLQCQKAKPDVTSHVAHVAYGCDDTATFPYFCQGSKIP